MRLHLFLVQKFYFEILNLKCLGSFFLVETLRRLWTSTDVLIISSNSSKYRSLAIVKNTLTGLSKESRKFRISGALWGISAPIKRKLSER